MFNKNMLTVIAAAITGLAVSSFSYGASTQDAEEGESSGPTAFMVVSNPLPISLGLQPITSDLSSALDVALLDVAKQRPLAVGDVFKSTNGSDLNGAAILSTISEERDRYCYVVAYLQRSFSATVPDYDPKNIHGGLFHLCISYSSGDDGVANDGGQIKWMPKPHHRGLREARL